MQILNMNFTNKIRFYLFNQCHQCSILKMYFNR